MKSTLLMFIFFLLAGTLYGQTNFDIRFEPNEVVLPVSYRDGINPVVEVRVNGQGPFRFMFDTGASGMARLDVTLQTQLRLSAVDSVRASDGSGVTRWLPLVELETLQLGAYEIRHPLALVRNYNRVGGGDLIDGVIGLGFFPDVTVELNFEKNQLILRKKKLTPQDQVIPFSFSSGVPEVDLVLPHKVLRGVIDTGNRGGFTFHADEIPDQFLTGKPVVLGQGMTVTQQFEVMQGKLKGVLKFGNQAIIDPVIHLNRALKKSNIGMQEAKKYNWTFDLTNHLVRILPFESNTVASGANADAYAGEFEGGRIISVREAKLFIQRPGGMLLEMVMRDKDEYGLVTVDAARFVFIRDGSGKIIALKVSRDSGATWEVAKKLPF